MPDYVCSSHKALWGLVSGNTRLHSAQVVGRELELAKDRVLFGIHYYKKPDDKSSAEWKKREDINSNEKDFVSKLSKLLCLEEDQAWSLFCSFLISEFRGTQTFLESLLSAERSIQDLLIEVWNFYRFERLYLLICLKHILAHCNDSSHPYQNLYNNFIKVHQDNGDLLKNATLSFKSIIQEDLPSRDVHGPYLTESCVQQWIHFNLREQIELLQIILLYFRPDEGKNCSVEEFYNLVHLFQGHRFGLHQKYHQHLNSSHTVLVESIGFCESIVLIELLKLHTFFLSKTENRDVHYLLEDTVIEKLIAIQKSFGSVQPHSVVLLGILLTNYGWRGDLDNARTSAILKLNPFKYIAASLLLPLFKSESVISSLVHTVIYTLLTVLLSLFQEDSLGCYDDLCGVVKAVLSYEHLADDFNDSLVELAYYTDRDLELPPNSPLGLAILFKNCEKKFPHDFGLTIKMMQALALAGQVNANRVVDRLSKLSCFTEKLSLASSEIVSSVVVSRHDINNWCLTIDRYPYKNDSVVLRSGCKGSIIQSSNSGDDIVISWLTDVDGWQILLSELALLDLQISKGFIYVTEEAISKMLDISTLIQNILETNHSLAPKFQYFSDLFIKLFLRFMKLEKPNVEMLTSCLLSFSLLSRNDPVKVWSSLSGFPHLTSSNTMEQLCKGLNLKSSHVGNIIMGHDCILGNYKFTLAYLKLLHCSVQSPQAHQNLSIVSSIVYLLREILPNFHKWQYLDLTDKTEIGWLSLKILHHIVNMTQVNTELSTSQQVCIYNFLYGEAGKSLLSFISIDEKAINTALEQQSDCSFGCGTNIINIIRYALSILNRVLLLRHRTKATWGDPENLKTPLDTMIKGQPQCVVTVAKFIFHRYDPQLPTLALRMLRRLAKEYPMSLLSCLGNYGDIFQEALQSRLMSVTDDIRLRVAILEFLSICIESQPGLSQMILGNHVKVNTKSLAEISKTKDNDKEVQVENQSQIFDSVMDILRLDRESSVTQDLHAAAIHFCQSMWLMQRSSGIHALKSYPDLWPLLFSHLDNKKASQCAAHVFSILALEIYACEGDQEDSLKNELQKFVDTQIEIWSQEVTSSLAPPDMVDLSVLNNSLTSNPTKHILVLMYYFRDFIISLARFPKSVSLPSKKQVTIIKDIIVNLTHHFENPINLRVVSLLSDLLLLLVKEWLQACSTDHDGVYPLMKNLLYFSSKTYDSALTDSYVSTVTVAMLLLRNVPLELDMDETVITWVPSFCTFLESQVSQISKSEESDTALSGPIVGVCALINMVHSTRERSLKWTDHFRRHAVIPGLVNTLSHLLKYGTMVPLSLEIVELLLLLSRFEEFSSTIVGCKLNINLWLPLADFRDQFKSGKSLEDMDKVSLIKRNQVFSLITMLTTALLKSQKYFFLQETLDFLGVHLQRLSGTLAVLRYSISPDDMSSCISTLQLVQTMGKYKQEWRLQHSESLLELMMRVTEVFHLTIWYLLRPDLLQHLTKTGAPERQKVPILMQHVEFSKVSRLSVSEGDSDSQFSISLSPAQLQLLDMLTLTVSTLEHFSPSFMDLVTDQLPDVCQWDALVEINFSTPSIDYQDVPPLTFGALISCINLCIKMLTKLEKEKSCQHNKIVCLLERTLHLTISQAILCMKDARHSPRDTQLLRRELGAELGSVEVSLSKLVKKSGSGAHGSTKSTLNLDYLKFLNQVVSTLFK